MVLDMDMFREEKARVEHLAFADFRLVGPFVEKCIYTVSQFGCGNLTPHSAHQGVKVPHNQEMALARSRLQARGHATSRNAKQARETYCKDVPAGQGKVFECLLSKRFDQFMEPECGALLAERAYFMGRDYSMAHPLVRGCEKEMKEYKCEPQSEYDAAAHFPLAWILLCLENGAHQAKGTNPPSAQCQHEMVAHRQMMLTELRMAPKLVMHCAQEIDKWCSPRGDIEAEGRTLHCLMEHASRISFKF